MQYKDYYKILGVSQKASTEEIKQAYKKLAMRYHPDQNPGNEAAEARFKEINEAKEVLGNSENRRKYDLLGQQWKNAQRARTGTGRSYRPSGGDPELNNIFTTFFEEIFGTRNTARRGKHYEANLKVSLKEAYTGIEEVLNYNGKRLKVKVGPGVKHGQILRVRGQGGPGKNGAPAGDLHIKIMLKPQSKYVRREDDLYMDLPVDLYTAVLGGKWRIATMKGYMNISIPAGTQPGEKLKLSGLGMPVYKSSPKRFGDLYLSVQVKIPKKLSPAEKSLFEQLASMKG